MWWRIARWWRMLWSWFRLAAAVCMSVGLCGQGSQFDPASYLQTMCTSEALTIVWAKTQHLDAFRLRIWQVSEMCPLFEHQRWDCWMMLTGSGYMNNHQYGWIPFRRRPWSGTRHQVHKDRPGGMVGFSIGNDGILGTVDVTKGYQRIPGRLVPQAVRVAALARSLIRIDATDVVQSPDIWLWLAPSTKWRRVLKPPPLYSTFTVACCESLFMIETILWHTLTYSD